MFAGPGWAFLKYLLYRQNEILEIKNVYTKVKDE